MRLLPCIHLCLLTPTCGAKRHRNTLDGLLVCRGTKGQHTHRCMTCVNAPAILYANSWSGWVLMPVSMSGEASFLFPSISISSVSNPTSGFIHFLDQHIPAPSVHTTHPMGVDGRVALNTYAVADKCIHTYRQFRFQFTWAVCLWGVGGKKTETWEEKMQTCYYYWVSCHMHTQSRETWILRDSKALWWNCRKVQNSSEMLRSTREAVSPTRVEGRICIFASKSPYLTHYVWMRTESQHSSSCNFNGLKNREWEVRCMVPLKHSCSLPVPPFSFSLSVQSHFLCLSSRSSPSPASSFNFPVSKGSRVTLQLLPISTSLDTQSFRSLPVAVSRGRCVGRRCLLNVRGGQAPPQEHNAP